MKDDYFFKIIQNRFSCIFKKILAHCRIVVSTSLSNCLLSNCLVVLSNCLLSKCLLSSCLLSNCQGALGVTLFRRYIDPLVDTNAFIGFVITSALPLVLMTMTAFADLHHRATFGIIRQLKPIFRIASTVGTASA